MPKMKVLETGQASDEVLTMSWSPKMDLLAVGTKKGSVQLHRLTWQKVWHVALTARGEAVVPELMAWHPEGLFIIVSSGCYTFVIDVECGKVVHSHELLVHISSMKWCTSQYRHAMNDILSSQSKQQSDYLRNDLKIQRLEAYLSILFLGTVNGHVYAYTGGFLLGLCLQIADDYQNCQILQMDASPSLQTFEFLTDEDNLSGDDVTLTFSQFRNDYIPRVAPIIGPLGLKYILFLKNWAMIQSEITSLNEHWARLVDLYNVFMTFNGTKDLEVARVDYLELLFTGVGCVELELFLGDGAREKEAKKSTNLINTANASITEHLRTIKCSIVNLLTELNEIGGFLQQISTYEGTNKLIIELRKSCHYLFLAILHIQSLVHNFVEVGLHFMHLITNTIHSFNAQELPEYIEEDADTDKVLEFLETQVDRDIFQFLIKNISLGSSDDDGETKHEKRPSPFGEFNFPEKNALGIPAEESSKRDFYCFPEIVRDLLKKHGKSDHPMLMDYSEKEVVEFLCNIIPKMNKLTKDLLGNPVLCSIPFEVDTHQIVRLPKNLYYLDNKDKSENESENNKTAKKKKRFLMSMDSVTRKTTLSCLWTSRKLLFFELDLNNSKKASVKSMFLQFTSDISDAKLFSECYVTVVAYEEREGSLLGKTVLCQVQYRNPLNRAVSVELSQLKGKCSAKSTLPSMVQVTVPMDITKPCVPANLTHVDYALPIDGFTPFLLKVSGPRKVGALVADNKRTVLLLEMETDLNETSYDDTAEASDSEASNANDIE